ncbi:hypothetical protein BX600DRAFT_33453 [Xylariales sp. PMI_506]|nr:hypothetical protein BX600DRAFT_33453 [Xylariales sp. PMI_506]
MCIVCFYSVQLLLLSVSFPELSCDCAKCKGRGDVQLTNTLELSLCDCATAAPVRKWMEGQSEAAETAARDKNLTWPELPSF